MADCWEKYLWKVHKAVPLDPWATNVELLDVLIPERPPSLWQLIVPPSWLHDQHKLPSSLSRAGSIFSLACKRSSNPKVLTSTSVDDGIGKNEQSDDSAENDATVLQSIDNSIGRGQAAQDPLININGANSDIAHRPQPVTDMINGVSRSQSILMKADTNATSTGFLLPNVSEANGDVQKLGKAGSGNQSPNKNKSDVSDMPAIPTRVTNNNINRGRAAQTQHNIYKNSDSSTEPMYKTLGMPDIQASIRNSTSLLASLTGGSSSARAQFDVKGSRTVTCNVIGVESRRVDVDGLMDLVTPHMTSHSGLVTLWQPDISLPQLQWCSKRGQTLWVVIEIMYASMIKIEADNQAQTTSQANVLTEKGVEVSKQVGIERGGVWTVTTPKDSPTFPFALRLQRLKYDANGRLVTSNKSLTTKNSFHNKAMTQLSSKHMHALYRSSSVSHFLP